MLTPTCPLLTAAQAEIERLNLCLNQLIPAEYKWRKRAIAASRVVADLEAAGTAALFPAGDTPAEVDAQLRSALTTARNWRADQPEALSVVNDISPNGETDQASETDEQAEMRKLRAGLSACVTALDECRWALNEILRVNGDGSTAGGDRPGGWTGGSGHAECRQIARDVLTHQGAYEPEQEATQ